MKNVWESELSLQGETTCQDQKPESCQKELVGIGELQDTRVYTNLSESEVGNDILVSFRKTAPAEDGTT